MFGERNLIRAGYTWHVFAYFPCNAAGVRVAIRKTPNGAKRFAKAFAKKNRVETSCKRTPPTPAFLKGDSNV